MAGAGSIRFDAVEIASWADSVFPRALAERRMSGLVLTFVQDGAVIHQAAYGFEDYSQSIPLDLEHSRVRIASVTKTFTAVAIAQLLERKQIESLDDPANKYLKRIRLPSERGEISLRHLLTHRAGFEEKLFGLYKHPHLEPPLPASVILPYLPRLVRDPGSRTVYSNFSTAVLGLIVEDVTGLTYGEYLRRHVFGPVGMQASFVNDSTRAPHREVVPAARDITGAASAIPYAPSNSVYLPGGGIDSTAGDMARYMLALLDARQGRRPDLLSAAMAQQLTAPAVRNFPDFPGVAMCFFTDTWNGERVAFHGGAKPGFESHLLLLLDSNAGIFFSVFGGPAADIPAPARLSGYAVRRLLEQRFLGEHQAAANLKSPLRTNPDSLAGVYVRQRNSHTTLERILEIPRLGAALQVVERHPDGGLRFNGVGPYREISPNVFAMTIGDFHLDEDPTRTALWGFELDDRGRPLAAHSHLASDDVYVRVGPMENLSWLRNALVLIAAIALTGFLAVFWSRGGRGISVSRTAALALAAAMSTAIASVALGFQAPTPNIGAYILYGQHPRLQWLSAAAHAIAALAIVLGVMSLRAWRGAYWGSTLRARAQRWHLTLLAAAGLLALPVFLSLNLILAPLP